MTLGRDAVFLMDLRSGPPRLLARAGLAAPGGGWWDGGVLGCTPLNDSGDAVFAYGLKPFEAAELKGFAKAGLYRYSRARREASPVVVPGVTAAPGFGVLQSVGQHPTLNRTGEVVFPGVVQVTGASSGRGLGQALFFAHPSGAVVKAVALGDVAPGGGVFDYLVNPWINDAGDVAFGGHIAGEECISVPLFGPACAESIYFRTAGRVLRSIAHQGDLAPGGGAFRWAWGPVLNNAGHLVFMGELPPPTGVGAARGIFLHNGGTTLAIARPGDIMPDGRKILTVNPGSIMGNYSLNDRGDVCFTAALENGESALYLRSHRTMELVAGTGTGIPGLGTISSVGDLIHGGALNNRGKILFWAILGDGNGVLLLTPPR